MTLIQPDKLTGTIAFNTLEKIRGHMQLRVEDILTVIGVSRPAYYGWGNGRKINHGNSIKAAQGIETLMEIAKHPDWNKWSGTYLTKAKRKEILDEILTKIRPSIE